jgi:predicted exporter
MTNANALPHRKSLRPALLWATLCLILLGVLLSLLPGARLNSSVLAMLPKQTLGRSAGAQRRVYAASRPPAGLAGQPRQRARSARGAAVAGAAAKQLIRSARSKARWTPPGKRPGEFFWQHRNGLIDPATRARLQNGGEAQAQWILSQLYSAFSGVSGKELQNDPLMLMRGSQLALAQNGQKLRLMDGWLVTKMRRKLLVSAARRAGGLVV